MSGSASYHKNIEELNQQLQQIKQWLENIERPADEDGPMPDDGQESEEPATESRPSQDAEQDRGSKEQDQVKLQSRIESLVESRQKLEARIEALNQEKQSY